MHYLGCVSPDIMSLFLTLVEYCTGSINETKCPLRACQTSLWIIESGAISVSIEAMVFEDVHKNTYDIFAS